MNVGAGTRESYLTVNPSVASRARTRTWSTGACWHTTVYASFIVWSNRAGQKLVAVWSCVAVVAHTSTVSLCSCGCSSIHARLSIETGCASGC
jgi:hypothetical protein